MGPSREDASPEVLSLLRSKGGSLQEPQVGTLRSGAGYPLSAGF